MSAHGHTTADQAGQADLFTARVERKYFLPKSSARAFVAGMNEALSVHRFVGLHANTLPRPVHFVSTLYFDNQERDFARACLDERNGTKIRVREYYDEHPDLAELATSSRDMIRVQPTIWLEVKGHTEGHSHKHRSAVDVAQLSELFAADSISSWLRRYAAALPSKELHGLLAEIGTLCDRHATPVGPDCVVRYRRRAWQDEQGSVRVTFDSQVAFFPAPASGRTYQGSLREAVVDDAAGSLDSYLVEVKCVGTAPAWLDALCRDAKLMPAQISGRSFSKFLAASRAVHGGL